MLPQPLINSLKDTKGFNEKAFIDVHDSTDKIVSIRINPSKSQIANLKSQIANPVPWCSTGYYLKERSSFTQDPLFHGGSYYVQEASSMFLEQVLKQTADLNASLKVLDLCAAPGGKSTLILSLLNDESFLVSNEVIKTRAIILEENISKWGAANVVITNNDPKDFQRLENYFDVMVVDAPCSGSGLFRKDPSAIEEWSEQNVELCSQRQQRILADALPCLKENGVLIYATCSYSESEDEEILDWLAASGEREEGKAGTLYESLRITCDESWGIVETQSEKHKAWGYRFFPDKVKGEGLFIAAFRKKGDEDEQYHREKVKPAKEKISAKELATLNSYLKSDLFLSFIKQNENYIALPEALANEIKKIQGALYIKKAGVNMGSIIRDELIPDHELAIATILNPAAERIELDITTALQYLRREDIKIDPGKKGWLVVTYQDLPLGWIKALPNRINNYYPKGWRILRAV
jgi:NOL1/NOP2/sun family putative RNA methylase